jgi:hypothetical protein
MLSRNEIGHWEYPYKFDPEQWFGFVYCIENTATNQFYIGKKQLYHRGKKKSKTFGKEMSWRTYVGSSVNVKNDIKKYGKDAFKFEIVDFYKTKGGLYYAEAYLQMLSDCMTEYTQDGKPRFYNRQIAAIRFVPSEAPTNRTKSFINKIKKRWIE